MFQTLPNKPHFVFLFETNVCLFSMNDSIDYVALVEQHINDEEMARRLQQEENTRRSSVGGSSVLSSSTHTHPPIRHSAQRPHLSTIIDLTG